MCRHADLELQAMLDTTAPPADLATVGVFRSAIKKFEKQA